MDLLVLAAVITVVLGAVVFGGTAAGTWIHYCRSEQSLCPGSSIEINQPTDPAISTMLVEEEYITSKDK
jgi:hypothetical protein